MKDAELSATLDVASAQTEAWLQRIVYEGVLEKLKKPADYIVKQKQLFEQPMKTKQERKPQCDGIDIKGTCV